MSLTFGSVDHSVASLLSVGSVGIRKSRESVTRPVSSLDANFSTTDLGVSKYPKICFPRGSTKTLFCRHSQTQKRSSLIIHPSKINMKIQMVSATQDKWGRAEGGGDGRRRAITLAELRHMVSAMLDRCRVDNVE